MKNATKIENIIKNISKAYISIDSNTKDFLINGKVPQEVQQDYYLLLYKDFESFIKLQISENCNVDLLNEFMCQTDSGIKSLDNVIDHLRVNYVLARSKDEINDDAENTNDYISRMLKIKRKALLLIKKFLENEIKYFGFGTSEDYKIFKENKEPDSDILISEKTERATFILSRKESLIFLYGLEKSGILKFDSDSHREKFIENNFNFTEMRNNPNKGKSLPIQGVKHDFPKLKSTHKDDTTPNNKVLENLKDKLTEGLLNFEFGK